MICNNCGIDNAEGAKFCVSCGTQLAKEAMPAQPGTPALKGSGTNFLLRIILVLNIITLLYVWGISHQMDIIQSELNNVQSGLGWIKGTLSARDKNGWNVGISSPPSIHEMITQILESVSK